MVFWNKVQGFVYAGLAFLNINVDIFGILILLMIADTAFGALKSTIIPNLAFNFKAMYIGISVKSVLLLIPMLTALTSIALGYEEYKWILDYVIKAIILSEFISIVTNFLSIRKRENIKSPDILAILLNYLKDKVMDGIKSIADNETNNNKKK